MVQPLISICIPAYNRADLIEETINSALSQTYTNIEVIVNDNCSTDNTWSLLEKISRRDSRVKIFSNDENLGAVKNWKKAMEKATGEYALILWSDDLIKPDFIEKTFSNFEMDVAFVMTGIEEFTSEGVYYTNTFEGFSKTKVEDYYNEILFQNKKRFPVSPSCALFRTDELRNSISEIIPNSDNIDFNKTGAGPDVLTFLINSASYPFIKIINEPLARFRSHGSSITVMAQQANGLKLHYDWAKFHFVKTYKQSLLPKLKAITWLRYYKLGKIHRNILKEMQTVNANFLFIFKLLLS